MKKQILPDNVFELLFGLGAGVVIIGALLKIINGSLIFSANTWLIVGLSIKVPADMEQNANDFNKGLSSASSNIQEVAKVLHNLKETVDAFETVNMPEGLGDEFQKMKNTVKELNAKYEAMLGAMNK